MIGSTQPAGFGRLTRRRSVLMLCLRPTAITAARSANDMLATASPIMSSIAALIAPQHHKPAPEKQRGLSATLTTNQWYARQKAGEQSPIVTVPRG